MTSSINTGVVHDNPHFSSQEMGIFCTPPTPTSKTTEPSLAATVLPRPPRARSSENAQFFEDSPPLSRNISGVSQ